MSLTLRPEVLSKYSNRTFCESGTHRGGGVETALKVGFDNIISIEIKEKFYNKAKERFGDDPRVSLYLGDSRKLLWEAIKDIYDPITFWLDGHTEYEIIPVIKELNIIGMHPIKTHTILIDDRRVMGTKMWLDVKEAQVIDAIRAINPNYLICYEPSPHGPADIIAAYLE